MSIRLSRDTPARAVKGRGARTTPVLIRPFGTNICAISPLEWPVRRLVKKDEIDLWEYAHMPKREDKV